MELRELLRLLLRGYKVIAATLIVAFVAALAVISVQTPDYRATTLVYVNVETREDATTYELTNATQIAQTRTITFKELVTTPLILDGVVSRLSLDMTSDALAGHVVAQSALDTSIVEIFVDWPEPEAAAQIANEIATEVISTLGSDFPSSLTVVQAQPAIVPTAPYTPAPAIPLGLAGFGGLLLGAAIVFLRQGLRRTVYFVEQLEPLTSLPIVGHVGRDRAAAVHNIAATVAAADRFHHAPTIAVVAAHPTAETTAIARELSDTCAETNNGHTVVTSPARLADREPIDSAEHIDSALVVVALGRDSVPDITTTLAHLELLGVTVGGLILVKAPRRVRRPAARGTRDAD